MGLFSSGGGSTKTVVAPNANVEKILKDIVSRTQGMDDSFISQQLAQMNPTQIEALNKLADSGQVNQISNLLMNQGIQGFEQQQNAANQYQNLINNQTTGADIQKRVGQLQRQGGLLSNVNTQGKNSGIQSMFSDDPSARRAANRTGSNIDAANALSQGRNLLNREISNDAQRSQIAQSIIGAGNTIGQNNINLGNQGVNLNSLATQNLLNVGNQYQAQANAQNQMNWQNANGAAQNAWDQLNNRLNVANSINGMVGYTSKGSAPGQSVGQQLLGAGITGIGVAGKLGAFDSLGKTYNAWDSYNSNGGQSGVAGPMIGGGNLSNQPQQSFWGNAYNNLTSFWG